MEGLPHEHPLLKTELHAHTDGDPADRITHSTVQLIDHAASLGYQALAVTLHDRYADPAPYIDYARRCGIVLLPGIEKTIEGRHVLLLNFPAECADVQSFDDLARLRARRQGLVVAPHPFYPIPSAVGRTLERRPELFDAVEINAMYTGWLDFNRRAISWARRHGKPLVGNSDLHLLAQMGTTYSLVDAPPEPDAICAAIRAGRVEVRSEALSTPRAAWLFSGMLIGGAAGRLRRGPATMRIDSRQPY
jgi:predicted metal-dependent phosphoesterase TrpH